MSRGISGAGVVGLWPAEAAGQAIRSCTRSPARTRGSLGRGTVTSPTYTQQSPRHSWALTWLEVTRNTKRVT